MADSCFRLTSWRFRATFSRTVSALLPHRVAVIGASGYGGLQTVRLIQAHPQLRVTFLGGHGSVGNHWRKLAPFLETGPDLHVAPPDPDAIAAAADLVVLSLPNGRASTLAPALLERGLRVVDLSADYRFADLEDWRQVYGRQVTVERADADLCGEAVYGLPEFNRQAIITARLVACPGCFPTTSLLALLPLLQGDLILTKGIIIDAKTGTSGGGREARQHLLLAEAGEAVAPYGVEGHRHTREMEIQATTLGRSRPLRLQFTPHLLPMVRGLLATVYGQLRSPDCPAAQLASRFRDTYRDHPCVDVLPVGVYPSTKWVRQTNRTLLSVATNPHTGQVVVMAALDNLLKGQAGQAVQCLNLMLGLPEATGLPLEPFYP